MQGVEFIKLVELNNKIMVIYKITNLINEKIYIGQSVNFKERIRLHRETAFNKNTHSYDYPLYRSIRKHK